MRNSELDKLSDKEFIQFLVNITNERRNLNFFGIAFIIDSGEVYVVSDIMPPKDTNIADTFRQIGDQIEKMKVNRLTIYGGS